MKSIRIITVVVFAIIMISSECGRPDMLAINEVLEDGSINRRLIMTYDEDKFDLSDMQVPVDSTWVLDKSLEVSDQGDSLWTIIAEKHFATVDELNKAYDNHTGPNEYLNRWTEFRKSFRWFNTVFYFSENVEKTFDGYPPEEYFEEEYLNLFYMPEKIFDNLRFGEDSLRYKAMHDTLEDKKELWLGRCIVKGAITELDTLLKESADNSFDIDIVRAKEMELGDIILDMDVEEAIDTLFGEGYYKKYQALIDTALSRFEDKFEIATATTTYLIQTKMPGELLATNGYIDTEGGIIWEVNSDITLSKDYSMWAESTVSNLWAWIVTFTFLVFVVAGLLIRVRKRQK